MVSHTDTGEFTDPRMRPFVEPHSRGELPHLYKEGGSYFVTFRLWDAVTIQSRLGICEEVQPNQRHAPAQVGPDSEPPLRLGSCLLGQPEVAEMVQGALRFFHTRRYDLAAWCVMPNHVHAVFTPIPPYTPAEVLHSWKSYTSHRINKLLGRTGAVWERESFDHLIRTVEYFEGS